jgi:hypothetical protein
VKLENDFDTDVCFQPFPDLKGIAMPYVVVPNKAEIPVFFNNATNEFISLKKGSALSKLCDQLLISYANCISI